MSIGNTFSNTRGEKRAFVQTGVFEKVLPMDILPVYLLKAIMAEDYDEMEALGIYEVIEEDMALCEFVDVSKHDVQKIVREGIDLLRFS
jgi:Na+-transporting NADH:ubiquinone oxidoreductase subunit A